MPDAKRWPSCAVLSLHPPTNTNTHTATHTCTYYTHTHTHTPHTHTRPTHAHTHTHTGPGEDNWWANNGGAPWKGNRAPTASVNFVSAHDGFTLADLVAYNEKHNEVCVCVYVCVYVCVCVCV